LTPRLRKRAIYGWKRIRMFSGDGLHGKFF
jgi:hypothetical protein